MVVFNIHLQHKYDLVDIELFCLSHFYYLTSFLCELIMTSIYDLALSVVAAQVVSLERHRVFTIFGSALRVNS